MYKTFFALIFFVTAVLAIPALAEDFMTGNIHIKSPWARATIPGMKNGAAFMILMNKGTKSDRLIGVSSPVAKKVELHTHKVDNNIMRMRHVKAVPVAAGAMTMLKPGGFHVMFMGLTNPLKEGATFPLTLTFEHAGAVQVNVMVQKIGAMKSGAMKSGAMKSGDMKSGAMKSGAPSGMHQNHQHGQH